MSRLVLKYQYDASFFDPKQVRDDFGQLSLAVETQSFAGKGSFWVQWQDVVEFAEALSVYPIAQHAPVIGQWGFDMQEGDDLILRIAIGPADSLGNLAVSFNVAEYAEPRNRVRGVFLTHYPEVEAFRVGITQLMNNVVDEAVLVGHEGPL